jgi:hypothetical protein
MSLFFWMPEQGIIRIYPLVDPTTIMKPIFSAAMSQTLMTQFGFVGNVKLSF